MTTRVARAWIGLGSNDERDTALVAALTALEQDHGLCAVSAVFASPCVQGGTLDYWNLVVSTAARLAPDALRGYLKALEKRLGRLRGAVAGGRVRIDLDLLILRDDDGVLRAVADLSAPHVLLPLAELLPAWHCPATATSLAERAAAYTGAPLRRFVLPALAYPTIATSGIEETSCIQ